MSPDLLFDWSGTLAVAGWAILILVPRGWRWLDAVPMLVIPAVLCALYALLVLTSFAGAGGGFGSLAEVRRLFADDHVLLAGWVHYLAFNLFVGSVLAARLDRAGVGRLVQGPILLLVFLLGPLGALLALLTEGALRAPRLPAPFVARPA